MQTTTLSEMTSLTPFIGREAKLYRPCSYSHPTMLRNFAEWRDIPIEDRETYSVKGDLPDVRPVCTDGIRFLSISPSGLFFFGHITNLIQPEKFVVPRRRFADDDNEEAETVKPKTTRYELESLL